MVTKNPSPEKVMENFVGYICENKADSRHVRRIAGWFGFVVGGIDRIADEWEYHHSRQFKFRSGGKWYKVRFQHGRQLENQCARGGLQFVEMDRTDARVDGRIVLEIRSYDEAEDFYNRPTLAPSPRVRQAPLALPAALTPTP
jgi:hypothetical protein